MKIVRLFDFFIYKLPISQLGVYTRVIGSLYKNKITKYCHRYIIFTCVLFVIRANACNCEEAQK